MTCPHLGCADAQAKHSGADLKKLLRREIDDLARRKALQGYEIPRDIIVDADPFSKANHLLTDSGKPARGKLKAKCAPPAAAGVTFPGTCAFDARGRIADRQSSWEKPAA